MDSNDSLVEPMPFFRYDPAMRERVRQSLMSTTSLNPISAKDSSSEGSPAIEDRGSVASSGVLGPGTTEVDMESEEADVEAETQKLEEEMSEEDDDGASISTTSDSSYGQLVRTLSTVRRGQARLVRNPSARKSLVPEVIPFDTPSPSRLTTFHTNMNEILKLLRVGTSNSFNHGQ
jgi:hypothetical protein